jgi:PAS domain S-box-containing protein
MEDDNKTKEQLVIELTELRSQNAALKRSITGSISSELEAEEARRYAESIVETVREPLLVLDADLKIISANRNFYRTFKVAPGKTIGSFIYDLGNKQWDIPKLRELFEEVLPEKETFDDFEVVHDFQDIGHKIMLLNARQIHRKDIGAKMILLAIEDITERKEIEDGLEKTRKELEVTKISEDAAREYAESIINTIREPLIALDHDLRVVTASRSFYKVFKVKPEETVGQLIYNLGNKQWNIPKLRELLEEVLPQKTTFDDYEVEHDFADIGRRVMLLNARQIQRVWGKERIILLAIEDITERKRMESLLIDSEERYRRLFETASDGIVLLEKREGKITHANPATEKMLGYTKKESIGNKLQDIGVSLDLDDFQTTMQNLNKSGITNYRNVKVETKSGHHIDTEIYLVDRSKLVQCNIRDITEHKLAKEQILRQSKLLAAINSVFSEMLTANGEESVARVCLKVAQEITDSNFGFIGEITPEGLFTTTALSDPGWKTCRIPETQAIVLIKDMVIRGIWGQVLLKDQSLIVNDPASHPDRVGIPEGHPHLTSFLGVPLKDQNKVIGMIAMANCESGYTADQQHDLEALSVAFVEAICRKQAEEQIRKLNEELEKRVIERTTLLEAANKELEAFSYSVSHDMRAPLRGIDGFSQALLEDYRDTLDDTAKSYLDRVRKATQHMGRLIDDMLKLSRVTRSEFRHESVNLSSLVRAISEKLQQDNPDRTVDVIIQEGVFVNGDPYLLQIAMENLAGNAWKFTGKEAEPQVEFGTTIREGKTTCFIRDNGVGFDMTYVDKLFGAFQRLHTSVEFPGTGIGLATVRRIINRHGGQVWAEAEAGKGATFYFTLQDARKAEG